MTLTWLYQVLTRAPVKVKLNTSMIGPWQIILVSISPSHWKWSSQHQASVEAKARSHPPPFVRAIERVHSLTMLGVTVNDRLSADEHVSDTIMACSKSLYALRVLRAHGMTTPSLHNVYRATVLAKLLYCNQAWSGFCSAAARVRIDSFISRSKRCGYCADNVPPVKELFADLDNSLFKRVLSNENHTLHKMLPPLKNNHGYNLRKRPHNHQLPIKGNSLQQSNFINRVLYAESY